MSNRAWFALAALVACIVLLPLAYQRFASLLPWNARMNAQVLSGSEIGDRAAQFVKSSQQNDGSFFPTYVCIPGSERCMPEVGSSQSPTFSGFAVAALLSAGERASSDRAIAYGLDLCEQDAALCDLYFLAFDHYLTATGEEKYRDAMEIVGEDALALVEDDDTQLITLARRNVPAKLQRMYEVTGNDRYKTALESLANSTASIDFGRAGERKDLADGHALFADAPILVGKVLVPAFVATKSPRYEELIHEYYGSARIESYTQTLLGRPHQLWEPVLATIEAYVALTENSSDEALRTHYRQSASLMMGRVAALRFDAAERSLFDGGDNFLTRPRDTDGDPTYMYKTVNENGRLAYLFLTKFASESFYIPGR